MGLPKQVEKQLKEIEELEKQLTVQPEEPPKAEEATPPVEEPPKAEAEQQPEVPESKPEVKPVEPVAQESSEDKVWQQKYKTLQGMYDAEVPRLHAQVKELQSYVDKLRQETEAKPKKSEETKREKLVTDADVEAFGADLIEVQRKVAREVAMEFRSEIESLRAENAELQKQIQQTGSQIGEVTFEQRLHRLVPDFAQINADPKWVAWLDEYDPLIRAPRRAVAQQAFNSGDAEGVAHYVKLFREATAEPAANEAKQTEVQRQVQPTRSAASQTPVSQKGRTYTTKDVEKMFQKITSLNVAQKFDEAKKLEAEIDAAYMEGRVTA
jgi:uncharacterized protein YukE